MADRTPQLDLFDRPRRRRSADEAVLIRRLREAIEPPIGGLSRREARRLMRPLPRITIPR